MKLRYFVAGGFALLASHSALAGNVRVDYSGTIDQMTSNFGSLTGTFEVGTRFYGHFTFDDSIAPTFEETEPETEASQAGYFFPAPGFAFHFEVGGVSEDVGANAGGYNLSVVDEELSPTPVMRSQVSATAFVGENPPNPGVDVVLFYVHVEFRGSELGLPLHSTELGAVPWSLSEFPESWMYLHFATSDGGYPFGDFPAANGTIDQLSVSVPEPASAALAALAALALTVLGFARAGAEAPAQADAPSIRML
jgi:hypothetical protein